MKSKILLSIMAMVLMVSAFGQRVNIELTFTAIDSAAYSQLDSIKIMNRTAGGDTVLYWPDTVLVLDYQVGIPEVNTTTEGLQVFQNYPNPVLERTTISIYVPEKEKVNFMITDILGRQIINTEKILEKGYHDFNFMPGNTEIYFFTARCEGTSHSIKILNAGHGRNQKCTLNYLGSSGNIQTQLKSKQAVQDFIYSEGDELLYIGYSATFQSGILDSPVESKTNTFQFATNIPCPGTPFLSYEGQVYNTIQIFSQCWLKENLNVGTMTEGDTDMEDDGAIEKYCYDDDPFNCDTFGGLYQWDEMMQYSSSANLKGICPNGWHIPNDEEWKVLEGAVDSLYDIGDTTWNAYDFRGHDAGTNLRTTSGWHSGGNGTDLFGFSGLPGGSRSSNELPFYGIDSRGWWWSTTEYLDLHANRRFLVYDNSKIRRENRVKTSGFSVRCLKDMEPTIGFIELIFTATDSTIPVQLDSIKVMNYTKGGDTILYWPDTILVLAYELESSPQKKSRQIRGFKYTPGDKLLYVGNLENEQSGIQDNPIGTDTIRFGFGNNMPCPGTPTIDYGGQIYNTIQVFSQCWMKENLNIGYMLDAPERPTDNDTIEKYCLGNQTSYCNSKGALYFWNELMNYTYETGSQGICPDGWHIPDELDWQILEGAVDSVYKIGDTEWGNNGWRGANAGGSLKQTGTQHWAPPNSGATDAFGFTALPGGYFVQDQFWGPSHKGLFWTSEKTDKFFHHMDWDKTNIERGGGSNGNTIAISVRCVKDN